MRMVRVNKAKSNTHLIHEHPTQAGFMKRRLGDMSGKTEHKIVWNYYAPRKRWEAICELLDVVFFSEADPADVELRKDRTLK